MAPRAKGAKGVQPAAANTRFKPGNPGRPKGARNKRTVWLEKIEDKDLKAVRDAVVEKAKDGDMAAARILLDRVWPAPKARKVTVDIPSTIGPDGISTAMAAISQEMAAGNIDPQEAQQMAAVIEGQRRVIETVDLATRIAALERRTK
jgi:hypothetical protein